MTEGLAGLRVVDLSATIAGSYCTLMLAQAGAHVVVVEPESGHPLRRRTSSTTARAGVLFDHLCHGKHLLAEPPDPGEIDVLVVDATTPWGSPSEVADTYPDLVVVAITPYGLDGPWSGRPGNDFTAQADSGALLVRGLPTDTPVAMGGELVEWVTGAYAAAAVAALLHDSAQTHRGDLLDVSLCEAALLTGTTFADLLDAFRGRPERTGPARMVESPSVEPTSDGYVGVTTNTPQQFNGFLDAIGRADLVGDQRFAGPAQRIAHWDEWQAVVHAATTGFTSQELLQRLVERRVPAAIVNDAAGLVELEHAQVRGCFVESDDGTYRRPRRAWREHPFEVGGEPIEREPGVLPLSGLRVVDLTAWWAGPSAAQVLAAFGADVIHVEAPARPDGLRMTGLVLPPHERWYDRAFFFHQINTNKRSLVVDAATADGRQVLLDLIAGADALIENFTPRVLESFGLDVDTLCTLNPRLVMARLPAFGLDGPWRDHPGFAQTMEQITGMAWVTGLVEDQPRVPRGPCDPNGGMHGAFAVLIGLLDAQRSGRGRMVESSLFDAALAIGAEHVVEYTANGVVLERLGNRSVHNVPQGLYPAVGEDAWLAVSCPDDASWRALCDTVGGDLVRRREWTTEQRRDDHDAIDAAIAAWSSARSPDDAADILSAAGVCAAVGRDPRDATAHPQMQHRGFFEDTDIDSLGVMPLPTWPLRSRRVDRWTRAAAPSFGADNRTILAELGYDDVRVDALYAAGVVSDTI